jgi:hypothetical protein
MIYKGSCNIVPLALKNNNWHHITNRIYTLIQYHDILVGKTTLLYKLTTGEVIQTTPTLGFNVETITYKDNEFTIWDMGGQENIRRLWRHYFLRIRGMFYLKKKAIHILYYFPLRYGIRIVWKLFFSLLLITRVSIPGLILKADNTIGYVFQTSITTPSCHQS